MIVNKIAIIMIYFGKVPDYFQLYLNSCKKNSEIDWIFFTDDKREFDYPRNVKTYYMSKNEMQSFIESRLKIKIDIEYSYKFCDFRPAYGEIFEAYLKEYNYWGFCDIDMIFGDLSLIINNLDIMDNDKILQNGHLTIFKNTKEINSRYKLDYDGPSYREVFSNRNHFGFDETNGITKIYNEYNFKKFVYKEQDRKYADINYKKYKLNLNGPRNYKHQYFIWDDGKIFRYYKKDNKEFKEEYIYIHFQKRNMFINQDINLSKFLIYPNGFGNIIENSDLYLSNKNNHLKNLKVKIKLLTKKVNQKIKINRG